MPPIFPFPSYSICYDKAIPQSFTEMASTYSLVCYLFSCPEPWSHFSASWRGGIQLCLGVECVKASYFIVSWHKQDNIQSWLHKVMWKAFGSVPKFLLFKHEEADHFCIPALIYRNWRLCRILPFKLSKWCRSFCIPSDTFEPSHLHMPKEATTLSNTVFKYHLKL